LSAKEEEEEEEEGGGEEEEGGGEGEEEEEGEGEGEGGQMCIQNLGGSTMKISMDGEGGDLERKKERKIHGVTIFFFFSSSSSFFFFSQRTAEVRQMSVFVVGGTGTYGREICKRFVLSGGLHVKCLSRSGLPDSLKGASEIPLPSFSRSVAPKRVNHDTLLMKAGRRTLSGSREISLRLRGGGIRSTARPRWCILSG